MTTQISNTAAERGRNPSDADAADVGDDDREYAIISSYNATQSFVTVAETEYPNG